MKRSIEERILYGAARRFARALDRYFPPDARASLFADPGWSAFADDPSIAALLAKHAPKTSIASPAIGKENHAPSEIPANESTQA